MRLLRNGVAALMLAACAAGCVSVRPQCRLPAVSIADFSAHLARQSTQLNAVVFSYGFFSLSGLGYTAVDSDAGTFAVSTFTPAGMKLFELSGDRTKVETLFALPDFTKRGDFAAAIAEDIRRIYFDRLPQENADVSCRGRQVVMRQPSGSGELRYIFAGQPLELRAKEYRQDGRLLWRVQYEQYLNRQDKAYTGLVRMRNFRYKYSLVLRTKEIVK